MNALRVTAVRIDCERIGINNTGGSDLRYMRMSYKASRVGLPITLQITARVTWTWSGWPRIARSHTEISLSLSELLHRDTNLACKRE